MKLWYWNLSSGCCSSLSSIVCNLRSRDVSSWLGSILEVWPQIFHLAVGLCMWKCSSHACCSAVMEDCPTGSTSQTQFKLCSRLLSSHSSNVCCVSRDSWFSNKFILNINNGCCKCDFLACPSITMSINLCSWYALCNCRQVIACSRPLVIYYLNLSFREWLQTT